MKKVFEGVVEFDEQDGGQALIASLSNVDTTSALFVRLQSYIEDGWICDHIEAKLYEGKRVRLTLEIIEDES